MQATMIAQNGSPAGLLLIAWGRIAPHWIALLVLFKRVKIHNIMSENRDDCIILIPSQGAGIEEETQHQGSDCVRQSEGHRHAYRSLAGDQPP